MKSLSKTLLALYLLTLLWLVLFKFSFDIFSVISDQQMRSINLIPFAGNLRETVDNFVVFIPFGLLLSVNFKRIELWVKLSYIFMFSLTVEMLQYLLAIGVTDISDIIANTLGGLAGLLTYSLGRKYISEDKLDRFIVICGMILLVLFIMLRLFVFRVRY